MMICSCDAEPAALAKYVLALLKKPDKTDEELKDFSLGQLEVFLQAGMQNMQTDLGKTRAKMCSTKFLLRTPLSIYQCSIEKFGLACTPSPKMSHSG